MTSTGQYGCSVLVRHSSIVKFAIGEKMTASVLSIYSRNPRIPCGFLHNIFVTKWSVKVKVLVDQLCPNLCDPMDCRPPGSSVPGTLQARILEWVGMPSSRGSSWPRDWTQVSSHCRQILYHLSHQRSPIQREAAFTCSIDLTGPSCRTEKVFPAWVSVLRPQTYPNPHQSSRLREPDAKGHRSGRGRGQGWGWNRWVWAVITVPYLSYIYHLVKSNCTSCSKRQINWNFQLSGEKTAEDEKCSRRPMKTQHREGG